MTTTDQRVVTGGESTENLDLDDPRIVERMVAPVARRAVEIVRDMRPENALARIVTPDVGKLLSRRAALTRRLRATTGYAPPQRMQVSGVRTCVVNEQTVEASCVLREPGRARFLAMRWELRHSGWRVTVLEIG
ncbi:MULTISPECIES: Rv3235 family protein [Brachybacterium]|uniref:DUF4440 domain-containing protein n=1 Tax=Brachybacterium alimentarium TaxID=47845 RepID=A0A2A3YIW4_9MICO|nr:MULTISPECIES: Rv3235 family protein [Brachybacterium]PCC35694.1 hypothetical protein CIK71_01825 [Brachybacterium alimentarium]PCC39221.1 hypothetical protein CIK66_10115 [Brachybacterium alimentarium]RCS64386.1 hypothetical protein CIK81_09990 [Brachybacterium sp. JB7]RCS66524.1 hypothetical protein CIK73_11925 [Brachybacterium alimentarium]RCS67925.1 hypothetical protein CIK68_13725 [Brachybacterium alimentarium]